MKTCLMLAMTLLWGAIHAQTVEEWPLENLPASSGKLTAEEITYRPNALDDRGFNRVVQNISVPTLTVYRPKVPAHRDAAVIICPGGGYQRVVIDREGHAVARYLQAQGITAVVLKYRLPEPALGEAIPRPQQDALAAMKWVRARALKWSVDPKRIGMLGFSAGGHLAGTAAVLGKADDGSRPDFVAMLYPVVTLEGPATHAGSRRSLLGDTPPKERLREYSLEHRATPGLPPFFLVHARDDRGVPPENSELLNAALHAAQVSVEMLLVESGGHGFSLGREPESARWKEAFLAWLDRLP